MTGNDAPIVGVGAVVISDGALLLVKRGHDPGKGLWAVPGGKVRHGETLRDAARREVLEETGMDIEPGDVAWVGEAIGEGHHIVLVDFHATVLGGEPSAADDADEARFVPFAEMRDLPLTATMHDLLDTLGI